MSVLNLLEKNLPNGSFKAHPARKIQNGGLLPEQNDREMGSQIKFNEYIWELNKITCIKPLIQDTQ